MCGVGVEVPGGDSSEVVVEQVDQIVESAVFSGPQITQTPGYGRLGTQCANLRMTRD
jgi:hypothetical protein